MRQMRVIPGAHAPSSVLRFFAAATLIAAAGLLLVPSAVQARTAVVVTDRLNVRPEPGTDRPPLATLNRGDRVTLVKDHGDWLEIAFGQHTGFVRNRDRYIRLLPETGGADVPMDASQVKQKAEAIAEKIEKGEKALQQVSQRERDVMGRLDEIGRNLNRARQKADRLEKEMTGIQETLEKNRTEEKRLQQEIDRLETYAAGRLVAYYKLQWLGTAHLLASADSLAEMIRRNAALKRIISADEKLWSKWTERRRQLDRIRADLDARRRQKRAVEASLADQIAEMKREKQQRAKILERIRRDKTLQLASIESLKDAESELARILEELRSREAKRRDLQAPETRDFAELKGLLPLPVKGKIVTHFGKYRNRRFNVLNFRSGIDIRADMGEPIHAVSGGRVLFAKWFKGYGNMIILDHGMFYYTVYAHAEELFKQKGDTVETGEVIATVGDTGSLTGPGLYFEIRHHGKPLDPSDWLSAG